MPNIINLKDEDGSNVPKSAADIAVAAVLAKSDGTPMFFPVMTGPNTSADGLRVFIGPTDPISDVPVTILYEHHQLHEGEAHQYTYAPAALSSGSSVDLRFVVGDLTATTRTPHAVIEVDCTVETWFYLYETPTTSANGTQQTVYNRNRNSSTTPASTVWLAPTVTSPGTLLTAGIIGSGRNGSSSRESVEWDLKTSTTYLYRVTAKAASDNVCIRLMWYEDLGV